MGIGMGWGWIIGLLVLVLVIWLVVRSTGQGSQTPQEDKETPLDVLKMKEIFSGYIQTALRQLQFGS